VGVIELALEAVILAEPIDAKIRTAQKAAKVGAGGTAQIGQHAVEAGVITADELACLLRRDELRDKVVRVDDFPQDFALETPAATELAEAPMPHKLAA
jgi:acyl-CoA dehydrogenase